MNHFNTVVHFAVSSVETALAGFVLSIIAVSMPIYEFVFAPSPAFESGRGGALIFLYSEDKDSGRPRIAH